MQHECKITVLETKVFRSYKKCGRKLQEQVDYTIYRLYIFSNCNTLEEANKKIRALLKS